MVELQKVDTPTMNCVGYLLSLLKMLAVWPQAQLIVFYQKQMDALKHYLPTNERDRHAIQTFQTKDYEQFVPPTDKQTTQLLPDIGLGDIFEPILPARDVWQKQYMQVCVSIERKIEHQIQDLMFELHDPMVDGFRPSAADVANSKREIAYYIYTLHALGSKTVSNWVDQLNKL